MFSSASVCVSVLLASLALSAADQPVPSPHQTTAAKMKAHYEHVQHVADFRCHAPQPRVIPVVELFGESRGKAYFPDVTVLHRCDRSGSCDGNCDGCMVAAEHSVYLPFKVTYTEDVDGHKRGQWVIDYYRQNNHTQCACSSDGDEAAKTTPPIY